MQTNTMTLNQLTLPFTEDNVTCLQEDSHVNLSALPGSKKAQEMTAISGQKCLEQYEKSNHVGLLPKMFPALLVGQKDWYSSRCYLIWKVNATKSQRLYFRLQASTPRTNGIGFGLLLTPTTKEVPQDLEKFQKRMEKYPNGTKIPNLATQVMGLLKTPTAQDFKRRGPNSKQQGLSEAAYNGLLPTPQARDYKGGRTSEALEAAGRTTTNSLNDAFNQHGKTSQLNHRFVLEMMGFQPTHCDSAFEKIVWERYLKKKSTKSFQKRLTTIEKNQSKQVVTP